MQHAAEDGYDLLLIEDHILLLHQLGRGVQGGLARAVHHHAVGVEVGIDRIGLPLDVVFGGGIIAEGFRNAVVMHPAGQVGDIISLALQLVHARVDMIGADGEIEQRIQHQHARQNSRQHDGHQPGEHAVKYLFHFTSNL